MEIIKLEKDKISSLEILEQINLFRGKEGNRAKLQHKDLLEIIRNEFEEEMGQRKISPTSYKDQWNREQPLFNLTLNQAKQILIRESKFVRRAIIHYIENLENKLKLSKELLESKYNQNLIEYKELSEELEELKYSIGNGKMFKSVNNIKWWEKYFFIEKRGIVKKLNEELLKISSEEKIPYDGIYPPFSNKVVLMFHESAYKCFEERLKRDTEFKIMKAYRRRF